MITRCSSPVDVAASGLVMRKSRYPLATCNLNKEKGLNTRYMHCYAPVWLLDLRLSQISAELSENMPVVRGLIPR
jgi:hypothetical protein